MNYLAHYDRLITRARDRVFIGYRERHHVIPRCIGGGDNSENLVDLTAEEHYVAHQLLVKIYPSVGQLAYAVVLMAPKCTGNKVYGWLRRRIIGVPKSPEHRAKIGAANRRRTYGPASLATRAKMSASQRGRKHSDESRAKISAGNAGKKKPPFSPEHRAKLVAKLTGRPVSQETRAKASAIRSAYWIRKKLSAQIGA